MSEEWTPEYRAHEATKNAILEFMYTFPGTMIMNKENVSISTRYFESNEAVNLAWKVFRAVHPYLQNVQLLLERDALKAANAELVEALQYIADNPEDSFEAPQIAKTAIQKHEVEL